MSATAGNSWRGLFAGGGGGVAIAMRVLKKRGEDFLVLPVDGTMAVNGLDLYPAQTPRARIVRSTLRNALQWRVPLPLETASVAIAEGSPFNKFLARLAGSAGFPGVAILCGNPRTEGRRFVLMLFGKTGEPVAVVKAGLDAAARALIEKEVRVLKALPAIGFAIPRLRDELDAGGIRALALDFAEGDSPRDAQPPAALLASWLHREEAATPVAALPVWQRLAAACAGDPLFARLSSGIGERPVCAAVYHGDFAPWNIKVSRGGTWTVLDWERGEAKGLPAWDWFHYVIQAGILVRHLPAAGLIDCVDASLASAAFCEYAASAGINGIVDELLLAYLLHCVGVWKPADSLPQTRALLEALRARVKK